MKNNKLLTVLLLLLIAITLVGVITLVIFLNTDSRSVEGSEPSIDEIVKASVEVPEITTNLSDDGFIRISFTIQTDSAKGKKELEKRLFQVKNLLISELSELEQADFDGKKGQANLEATLKTRINSIMQEGTIEKVYITSRIIQ